MSFLTRSHKQDIVYWGSPTYTVSGGKTFAAPVEIKGRWEDKQRLFMTALKTEQISSAFVYLGQDVDIGGYLFLGKLEDISSDIDDTKPELVAGAHEILSLNKTPNILATDFEREVIV